MMERPSIQQTIAMMIPTMIMIHGRLPERIPVVRVAIRLACGKPNGGLALLMASCGARMTVVPTTTITPIKAAIMKYFIISERRPPTK